MWQEGVCIYGTPGVPNNFSYIYVGLYLPSNLLLIIIIFLLYNCEIRGCERGEGMKWLGNDGVILRKSM